MIFTIIGMAIFAGLFSAYAYQRGSNAGYQQGFGDAAAARIHDLGNGRYEFEVGEEEE